MENTKTFKAFTGLERLEFKVPKFLYLAMKFISDGRYMTNN